MKDKKSLQITGQVIKNNNDLRRLMEKVDENLLTDWRLSGIRNRRMGITMTRFVITNETVTRRLT